MKPVLVIVSLILVALGISGCATANPLPYTPSPTPTTISRIIDIGMTGIHMEYFNFQRGDSIAGWFRVNGSYPVSLSVVYYQNLANREDTAMARVLDIDETLEEKFTFVAPISTEYVFFFEGYYANRPDWKPYATLYEKVTLELTIHRE